MGGCVVGEFFEEGDYEGVWVEVGCWCLCLHGGLYMLGYW